MVSDRRIRWVPQVKLRFEASLDLDYVTTVREKSWADRYAIAPEHAPLERLHREPAYRFLGFEWGYAEVSTPLGRTELAFSRRDTEAARALRDRLAVRGVLG
ncbi:MAG: hypothetical protein HY658_01040 [Actinobacteria bacterium]|nr:hypothetical protein [Actinomycetota bacterium]